MSIDPASIPAHPDANTDPHSDAHAAMAAVLRARMAQQAQQTRADRPFAAPVSMAAAASTQLGEAPGVQVQAGRTAAPDADAHVTSSITLAHVWRDGLYSDELFELVTRPIPEPSRPAANVLAGFSTPQWTPLPVAPSTIPTVDTPPAERAAVMAVAASLGRQHVQRAVVDVPPPEPRREIPEASRQSPHRARRGLRAWRRRRPLTWFRRWAS